MPLTPIQRDVLQAIAGNRSPESHIAGGIALNFGEKSARYSEDIDIFHDVEEAIIRSSEQDVVSLEAAGFTVERQMWAPYFRRVLVSRSGEAVKVEWAQDSAWRFFPVESDPVLCWRLHRFDALTNKALAMGARAETRDLVDLVVNSESYALHAVIWAACSKDPGFTPLSLLEWMRRNARVQADVLSELGVQMSPVELKEKWLNLAETAESRINDAADAGTEAGVAFLGNDGQISWVDTELVTILHAQLGGVVPRIEGVRD
ncbi:MAG: hypothetical protein WCO60_18570 [Verrucomicrobiota bacterium]